MIEDLQRAKDEAEARVRQMMAKGSVSVDHRIPSRIEATSVKCSPDSERLCDFKEMSGKKSGAGGDSGAGSSGAGSIEGWQH